jgi:hypothetical protein
VPAHGKTVQISGVPGVPGPAERIFPLHDEAADDLTVDLREPGLAGFDRRHHPVGREPVGPLRDTPRPKPCRRVRENGEHDFDLVGSCSPNSHSSIVTRPPVQLRRNRAVAINPNTATIAVLQSSDGTR